MTRAEAKFPVAILVPGPFHEHARGRIEQAFQCVRIERADPSLLSEEMRQTVRGIASYGGIDAAMIDALPNLEIIANFGVGYDSVDAGHAAARGVMVTNTPDVLTEEVADTAIGLLINTVRELYNAEKWLRDGGWMNKGDYRLSRLTLRGRRIGIFGMGRIGLAVARRLEAFGLPIAYHNRRKVEGLSYEYHSTLMSLAEAVDTLICVAPGGASTEKAINADILLALGSNGVLVNIGRGSVVDEAALAAALANGTIAAAGLDVFADEPNVPQALLDAPNTSLLPHVGSASHHTRRAMADLCVDNLIAWFGERRALTPVPETVNVKARP
ncbi:MULTISPECIES: 2-hydroxyacid dehydrogenase [unclassified Mesorhizobium]|uniref:2-hydroxyacid dehydrogenase n=1 Tax=unclassified Mesorhizobium TaxID=325217 RepID=UPI000BAF70B9|nr:MULTISPECIES: 2-hydroxyacid dehydrogenase [unclassified Mesorhizobium]TGT60767.1 2-hydroxyacid dehydrogenase [Mesorhizobium sp. M00.F.Ca.ET.170.01.1.1]AZO10134.1 2-hydroxyacid dehydrogenase [Mesorhizobium sp. M3A.F.Ca.ET.080.04.2.1]PBB86591.1 2-hydroxyacid dehydrogenase [Mesorhizobium sp. WSM3876]RWB75821.1 MAG: 2-hydroxyacid dehydrogenase [Mesorhizobium sp.]RWB91572.1 MAG: 2-hydroxyacid dehydrogenase [Mesorhizobium sp.]